MKAIVATGINPTLSAQCASAQLSLSEVVPGSIPVVIGEEFPDPSLRGGVCAFANLGFAMEPECLKDDHFESGSIVDSGIEYIANMIIESNRSDWYYLVVGGQSSLMALMEDYPEAAAKIDTLVVMAGNFCGDFEPYPDVMAPTDETNIGCDPIAANYVLDANNGIQFKNVYYVPVVMAAEIGGEDYKIFVDAANSGTVPSASATLEWYKIWSDASRLDDTLLVHLEAMTYDPVSESTPQFDPAAVMLILELLDDESCDDRVEIVEVPGGVHFLESTDGTWCMCLFVCVCVYGDVANFCFYLIRSLSYSLSLFRSTSLNQ